jgi:hypothetical protein
MTGLCSVLWQQNLLPRKEPCHGSWLQNEKRRGNFRTLRIESLKPEAYLKSQLMSFWTHNLLGKM